MGSIEEDIIRADDERRKRFRDQLHALLELKAQVVNADFAVAFDPDSEALYELRQKRLTAFREALESFETWKGLL